VHLHLSTISSVDESEVEVKQAQLHKTIADIETMSSHFSVTRLQRGAHR
jgi:hypothetical protein